ncbi:MAG: hypothetical protein RLZZ127_438 [Planctomycetota bacterium]|jgi:phosphoglycerol transferase MdoB-like AlkP superfamily enzyme
MPTSDRLRAIAVPVATWLAIYVAVMVAGHLWVPYGGMSGRHWLFEIPFALAIAGLLYHPWRGTAGVRAIAAVLAMLPVLVLWLAFDIAGAALQAMPRATDLLDLPTLWDSAPWLVALVVAALPLALAPAAGAAWRRRTAGGLGWRGAGIRLAALAALAALPWSPPGRWWMGEVVGPMPWSWYQSARRRGRMYTFIWDWHQARNQLAAIRAAAPVELPEPFPGRPRPRDVFIIVLESFIDPRLLDGVSYAPDPLHPDLAAWLAGRPFAMATSPVFGGRTPQAEFEVLSGAPALARFDSIDFRCLHGGRVRSLPAALAREGWRIQATIGTRPEFFNSARAYPALGLDRPVFVDGPEGLAPAPGEKRIFDGDLLDAVLERARRLRREGTGPIMAYALGYFGHIPFAVNLRTRGMPVSASVAGAPAQIHAEAASVFRHRTGALGRFLAGLDREFPDAVVLVVSDHLPLGVAGAATPYRHDLHRNILLLADAGTLVGLDPDTPYHHLPHRIWSLLGAAPWQPPSATAAAARYDEAMARGLGIVPAGP